MQNMKTSELLENTHGRETTGMGDADIKREIKDLNIQIENNLRLMNDYRLMQTGDFNKEEIREENKQLILERNQLISML
jgi:hypothetical protein